MLHALTRAPRRTSVPSAMLVAVLLTLATAQSASPLPGGQGSGLGRHDRELLADARVKGKTTVTLLVAARSGAGSDVAGGLQDLGARVDYRDDALGYLRVKV
ncbi:MAG TPA: hypothetical protein VGO80_16310, partial [Solirubrobacteraceae bacterium]|nr:hypothetical protein [Solirubrobacteraceae bacterium]